jgi:hypothetical protein
LNATMDALGIGTRFFGTDFSSDLEERDVGQ